MANTLNLGDGNWGVKKDSLLGYNSENGNYKPLPFDFTRASSATVVNKDGLIETVGSGEPRIDYKDDAKGALLLEPTRSNLFEYSESFSNSYWTKNGITESIGYLAPDGSTNAYKLIANAVDSTMYKVFSVTSGTTYSLSFYLKTVSGTLDTTIGLGSPGFPQNEGDGGRYKNITVTNEWKRYTLTSTADATASSGISFGGFSGFTTGEEVLIYGAQLEQGSYATSYIPTQGSAVTRVADVCSNENLNINYSGDYTLYLEHETLSITEYNQFQFRQETSISYIFRVGNSISVGSGIYSATNTIGFNKFALSVGSDGSYSFYKNGSLLSSGSGLNANLETIKNDALGMSIKDIKLYNTRLSNAELQALTSN